MLIHPAIGADIMGVTCQKTTIPGVLILEPDRFGDARGFFMELFQKQRYHDLGITCDFVQDNCSRSCRGTLRGLHTQQIQTQDKLLWVPRGAVYDVVVDGRRGSPFFGRWEAFELSEENRRQVFVPKGCFHGFCVTSESADVYYKVSDFYCPPGEVGVAWDDPDLAIPWPVSEPLLSGKDKHNKPLREIPEEMLFPWK